MTGETDLVDKPPHNNDDQNVRRCQFKPRKRAICCKNHQDKNKDVYDTLYDTGISEVRNYFVHSKYLVFYSVRSQSYSSCC